MEGGVMRKIGIITILKVNNYGAELQAYATQCILNKLGWSAEIIDYLFYKNPEFKKTKMARPLFPMGNGKWLKEHLFPILNGMRELRYAKSNKVRKERFARFHRENTALSKTFKSMDELYRATFDYDVYMVGSDQVWNPGIYSSLEPYFLTFAPKGKKRVSYASSFGVSDIPEVAKPFYRKQLAEFSAISVRENTAVDLVKQLSGRDAQWVLDPTLLLSAAAWRQVCSDRYNDLPPFVLVYELTPCAYIAELAKYIAKEKKLSIVRICKSAAREDENSDFLDVVDAGPAEFLELFGKAAFIVTNSFHGTAFSINFNKSFYTVIPHRKKNNSRQQSLLGMLDLKERMIWENSEYPDLNEGIDYTHVNMLLDTERDKSIKYLKEAIDGK